MTENNNSKEKVNPADIDENNSSESCLNLNDEILNATDEILSESMDAEFSSYKEEQLQLEINQLKDQLLRAAAEVQNVRRRSDEDVKKARHFSIESFAKDLLSVMDSLSRAAESVAEEESKENSKINTIIEGIKITQKELSNVFERNGVKCVNPLGEQFNPDLHQAMSQVENSEKESGIIIDVMQKGYTIKNRLIRPALVIVVK